MVSAWLMDAQGIEQCSRGEGGCIVSAWLMDAQDIEQCNRGEGVV